MLLLVTASSCQRQNTGSAAASSKADPASLLAGQTFAELRTVKGGVTITAPGEPDRAPYPRERIVAGELVHLAADGLAWMRRDGGATWLVSGPAELELSADKTTLKLGKVFIDSEQGEPVTVVTPKGEFELTEARASIEVGADAKVSAYVLRGSVRAGESARAGAGEMLTLQDGGQFSKTGVVSWQDWTGGLGTADAAAAPAPFGVGTVGARKPDDKGQPRFALVVQRLDVKVKIEGDFAVTEVDQTFVNPSSDVVEGLFSFRTPPGAVLQRFGVDRDGDVVWGRIKESAAAVQQYESNVYAGSTEDPALLQWQGAGVYSARLYPIEPGARRRVLTRYAEWLPRQGPQGERRLYVYPMAAEGAKGSLPRIEELTIKLDLTKANASKVRAGMGAKRNGKELVVKAFDFTPRADLAVELFDAGQTTAVAYRAAHNLPAEEAPESLGKDFARTISKEEADYLAIPLRAPEMNAEAGAGIDLAIVVDTSAATEPSALAIARTLAGSLLAHLGPSDRAALWTGDAVLHPAAADSGALVALDALKQRQWLAGLAGVERGGATDLGALLTEAAGKLDPKRRGAVIYIGDGAPSVGELSAAELHTRLERLPASTRVFAAAVGSQPNMALLESVARGAAVQHVFDAYGAARAALRLLESAGRSLWLDAKLDLGPGVERVLPRVLPPISADETLVVVGRVAGVAPTKLTLTSSQGTVERPLQLVRLSDQGDLRRRWGQERLWELMNTGAGRASLVDIGQRFGIVSPVTSLYVPTRREAQQGNDEDPELAYEDEQKKLLRWKPWAGGGFLLSKSEPYATMAESSDNKEGGTGTRAKGEEGSMGNPNKRYAVRGPADNPSPPPPMEAPASKPKPGGGAAAAPAADKADEKPEAPAQEVERSKGSLEAAKDESARQEMIDTINQGAGGLGLSGVGEGGGGKAPEAQNDGVSLGNIGTIGHGAGTGTGQGFGSGSGRLGGSHKTSAPKVRMGEVNASGRLPREVIARIVRQNFGRARQCYETGLGRNPNLEGKIRLRFVIDRSGSISNIRDAGSSLPDAGVVTCVRDAFGSLSFPQPEGGIVTVSLPIDFSPGGGGYSSPPPSDMPASYAAPTGPLGSVGHVRVPCGPGADLPLAERKGLWRERLAQSTSVDFTLTVYRRALSACEASDWSERSALLVLLVDHLTSVQDRVQLWRTFLTLSPIAADAIYRSILLRVQTSADLKALHVALGWKHVEPELLKKLLDKGKDARDRLALLRGAAEQFGDDTELALLVLDAYEDAQDDAGGRAWARKLRRRADATAHVRTNVGEYYLRLATRGSAVEAERDRDEARRTFGELVEFAPDDPLARRLLGDLLRAHGWYDQAARQYETLASLTPDDPSVPLLLAAAAQGTGKVEEAVRWLEKASGTSAPDAASPVAMAARAYASAYLAWTRQDSLAQGKADEVERLRTRAARLVAAESGQGLRVILSWAHPELRVALWTNAMGAMMPAPDNQPLLGVAQAYVPISPTPEISLRLDPEDAARAARLGMVATLTVLRDEGNAAEVIVKKDVMFKDEAGKALDTVTLSFADGALNPAPRKRSERDDEEEEDR